MQKIAILCTGELKTYRKYFHNWVKNVVKPNQADVFLVLKKDSAIKGRNEPFRIHDEHDATTFLIQSLGSHLRFLCWTDDDPQFEPFVQQIKHLLEFRKKSYGTHHYTTEEKNKLHSSDGSNWFDQYARLSHGASRVRRFLAEHNESIDQYTKWLRFRVDMTIPKPFQIQRPFFPDLNDALQEVCIKQEYSHSCSEIFVAGPQTFFAICEWFIFEYLHYRPRRSKTLFPFAWIPEVQIGQFLLEFGFKTFHFPIQYRYYTDEDGFYLIECFTNQKYVEKISLVITLPPNEMTEKEKALYWKTETLPHWDDSIPLLSSPPNSTPNSQPEQIKKIEENKAKDTSLFEKQVSQSNQMLILILSVSFGLLWLVSFVLAWKWTLLHSSKRTMKHRLEVSGKK